MPNRPPTHRPPNQPSRRQQQRAYDARRGSATQRGYGNPWRKLRLVKLQADPLCESCLALGITKAATDVDHKTPKSQGGDDSWDNLQSLCGPCHSRKTATEDGGFGHKRPGV